MKKILLIIIFFSCQNIIAADYRSGKTIIINRPVYEDLYISAGTVIINAPVFGDLVIIGGNVTINDTIRDDILLLGGSITINSYVADDIRCAGATISIAGYVEGDVLVTSGEISIEKTANIESLSVVGGEVLLIGIVRNDVYSRSGSFRLNGKIMGDADLRGGQLNLNGKIYGKSLLAATEPITIGDSAYFAKSIHYWQPLKRPLKLNANVARLSPIYDPLLSMTYSKWYFLGASTFIGLLWYLGMAYIMIMIIQYLFPSILRAAGRTFHQAPLFSAVYGISFFVGVPVVIVICLITVIGVPVSAILAVGYILLFMLTTIINSLVLVNWVNFLSETNWSYWRITGTALFTFVLLKITYMTPFFGLLLMITISAISYGAILSNVKFNFKRPSKLKTSYE